MPLAGFEPTIPVFKLAKTFHASDRAATVTGQLTTYATKIAQHILTSAVPQLKRARDSGENECKTMPLNSGQAYPLNQLCLLKHI
jgi:hypothetical protein